MLFRSVVALDSKQGLLHRTVGRPVQVIVTVEEPVPALPPTLMAKLYDRHVGQLEFRLDRDVDSIVDFLDQLRRTDLRITDLRTEEPDLEDVFLELTRGAAE